MNDASVENALDSDGLTLGDRTGIFSARPEIDQRSAAAVLDDELVAENLEDVAPDSGEAAGLQSVDRDRLQQHDASRLPILGDLHSAGAGGCSSGEDGKYRTREQASGTKCQGWRAALLVSFAIGHLTLLHRLHGSELMIPFPIQPEPFRSDWVKLAGLVPPEVSAA
jgi:hypothetical protein